MQSDQWQAFIAQFAQLSHHQRKASADLLRNGAQQETVICLIEQAAQAQLHCPACNSFHFHRHGHDRMEIDTRRQTHPLAGKLA